MLILAVEQSTRHSSAVVSSDSEVITSVTWEESRLRSQQLFGRIEKALSAAGRDLGQVDLFAAGVGPGAFNALRMCLSTIKAFALPDSKPVYAVSSAQALALQLSVETGKTTVSIVGDARRGHLWVASSTITAAPLPDSYVLHICTPDELPGQVAGSELIASPDFERIPDVLGSIPGSSERLYRSPVSPDARFIAETAFAATEAGIVSPPLTPIYIHPPV